MSRPRIVIVGAGFAGYQAARTLSRLVRHRADVTLLNPTDYFLYLPLLPQVAAGILEPRRVTVSLSDTLPHVRLVLGEADAIDLDGRTVRYTDPEGGSGTPAHDRLVLAVGSVNKLLPIPGVAEHAHGFRGCRRRCRAGCCSISRRASCPSWTNGSRARRTGCCGRGASRCARGPPCRRPRTTESC